MKSKRGLNWKVWSMPAVALVVALTWLGHSRAQKAKPTSGNVAALIANAESAGTTAIAKRATISGAQAESRACPNDDSGLTLPSGFCATVFADDIGHARHMVVAPSGV